MGYDRQAGKEISVATEWPRTSALVHLPGQPTVILAAHPKCPCTEASLLALADLVARSPVPIRGYVLFLRPTDLASSWAHTELWDQASKIPGFLPLEDVDGREARLLGATTSGHVLYFDGQGSLRYSGGITSARGSRGESAGKNSLLALLTYGKTPLDRTPVFGCPLEDHESR
ncbi:MAG TPA: RedB protein [Planctomycetota bacterium]|nr:RedB protein [Planctomycetota bacterium]